MEESTMEKDKNVTPQKQEQVNNTIEVTEESKKKTLKLAKIAGYIGLFLVLAPFFITGFGFNWFFYLIIIVVAICALAMFGTDGNKMSDYSDVKNTLVGFLVVGCIMFIWGPLNSNYGSDDSSSSSSSNTAYTVLDDGTKVPSWIIGHWKTSTPYGDNEFVFNSHGVVLMVAGNEQSMGTYNYGNGVIRCRFKNMDGMAITINVDENGKRLDAGHGTYMTKIGN
jgi:hypothetical protein